MKLLGTMLVALTVLPCGVVFATEPTPQAPAAAAEPKLLPWLPSLAEGYREALAKRKPVLVRVGGESCVWCRKLDEELKNPGLQKALHAWTLVYLDVERSETDVRRLGVGAIPALWILTADGREIARHDGYLTADEWIALLIQYREPASVTFDNSLLTQEKPLPADITKLIAQLNSRNPAVRAAASQRLYLYPEEARAQVVQAVFETNLATRLAALELLQRWKAPISGLDPWRPESLTPELREALNTWKTEPLQPLATNTPLSDEQLAGVRQVIDRMLTASDEDAAAMREQLAHFREGLVPEVAARLADTADDRERERLWMLRYRLAASDILVLRWPGGIERLASLDSPTRRKAADELVAMAGTLDQPLLLELFADPDPLVRELSLRAIQHMGGPAAEEALIKRLSDPEPNVRAAVLKQLAENPLSSLVKPVGEYVAQEQDDDLVVHAIRFLRAVNTTSARKVLRKLLEHDSWQVRAEAIEGLKDDAISRAAIVKRLDDPEPFVVARVLLSYGKHGHPPMEVLLKAAEKQPSLLPNVVQTMVENLDDYPDAKKHLREYFKQPNSSVRAQALLGLVQADPQNCADEVLAAMNDEASEVRIAGAQAVSVQLEREWQEHHTAMQSQQETTQFSSDVEVSEGSSLWRDLSRMLLGPGKPPKARETASSMPLTEDTSAEPETTTAPDTPVNPADSSAEPEPPAQSNPPDAITQFDAQMDAWLAEFPRGEDRKDWVGKTVPKLRKMLNSQSAEERLVAAKALLPLHEKQALEVWQTTLQAHPQMLGNSLSVLHWLPSTERVVQFEQLRQIPGINNKQRAELVAALGQVSSRPAADAIWRLLDTAPLSSLELSRAAYQALEAIYLGNEYRYHYFNGTEQPQSPRMKLAIAQITPHLNSGSQTARFMALVLLSHMNSSEVLVHAGNLLKDPSLTQEVREAAFQLQLLKSLPHDRHALALAALENPKSVECRVALGYLTSGSNVLQHLSSMGAYFSDYNNSEDFTLQPLSNLPVRVPQLPRGLKARHVRPLINDEHPAVAARAAYLLVLTGDETGMEPLLLQWRNNSDNSELTRLVYRAIAVTDKPEYLPVLEEIFKNIGASWEVSDFYWTIRAMGCEGILAFRERIRKEVPADRLR